MRKILVVDDQPDNVDLLEQALEDAGFDVVTAENGKKAIEEAEKESPEVILLDVMMPEMDGYQACKKLKENPKTRSIPIIFLTANAGERHVIKGLGLGAHDYVTKPFNEGELVARIKVMLRIRDEEKETEQLAVTDPLTGLYNRRFLLERFGEEIARTKRSGNALSCLILDIDYFKKINDAYGHDFGDIVLKGFAEELKSNLRGYDAVVRYGGEEFFVLLPGATIENAQNVAEKIRKTIEKRIFKNDETEINVTVSIGVFGSKGGEALTTSDEYISCADKALYQAKEKSVIGLLMQYRMPCSCLPFWTCIGHRQRP